MKKKKITISVIHAKSCHHAKSWLILGMCLFTTLETKFTTYHYCKLLSIFFIKSTQNMYRLELHHGHSNLLWSVPICLWRYSLDNLERLGLTKFHTGSYNFIVDLTSEVDHSVKMDRNWFLGELSLSFLLSSTLGVENLAYASRRSEAVQI